MISLIAMFISLVFVLVFNICMWLTIGKDSWYLFTGLWILSFIAWIISAVYVFKSEY